MQLKKQTKGGEARNLASHPSKGLRTSVFFSSELASQRSKVSGHLLQQVLGGTRMVLTVVEESRRVASKSLSSVLLSSIPALTCFNNDVAYNRGPLKSIAESALQSRF